MMTRTKNPIGISNVIILMIVLLLPHGRTWGESLQINGFEMHYEVIGEGDPLVLLHGFFGAGVVWDGVSGEFAENFQVIIPDLRGHGASTNPSGKFRHKQSALDVYSLLDHLKIDRFKAMGISTGGMTLLHMATQQPARIDSMVLIGATTYFPEVAREIQHSMDPNNVPEERIRQFRERHKHGDAQIVSLMNQFSDFADNYDDMNFTAPYLSTITAKTLIVHGDRDRHFPVNIPFEAYKAIPDSYLWIVPNGGHVPIFDSIQDYFVETAKSFLTDQMVKRRDKHIE